MAENVKGFPIGATLTGTSGKMLCEDFGDFHGMVEFLCGGPVWTHELPSLAELIRADLLRQHPDLPTDMGHVNRENARKVMDGLADRYGPERDLTPIPDYSRTKGPIETLHAALAAARGEVAPDA